jgi:alkylation response protein AidB-like acyl-CoA dehydrogenase
MIAIPSNRTGVSITDQKTLGNSAAALVRFESVVLEDTDVVLSDESAAKLTEYPLAVAALVGGAHAIGAAETALALSVEHSRSRSQFGRPIGTYQSVSNRCADMRVVIDSARLVLLEAAAYLESGVPQALSTVSAAKISINRACRTVTQSAHQIHGAIGYSTEYPLHKYTRLIKRYETVLGSTSQHAHLLFERNSLVFD